MPRSDNDVAEDYAASRRPSARTFVPGDLPGDILVVDDCATSLTMVTHILARAGYSTRTARDGKDAEQAIATRAPSLVLVDRDLPCMDQPHPCAWIVRQVARADYPVLILSNIVDPERKAEALRSGCADFIAKPVEPEELLLRVGLHLQLAIQQRALRRSFEEREAEVQAQLRRSNSELLKLHAAVEQSPSSIVITDAMGSIEYVNQKFTEITGYSFDEAKGKPLRLFGGVDKSDDFYRELWDTMKMQGVWRGTLQKRRKDGSLFWEHTVLAPVRAHGDGTITHFIGFKEDVTAQREVEVQRQQAQKMEAIGQLAAGIAHEINTPTQFVNDNLTFLKGAFDDLLALLGAYRQGLASLTEHPEHAAVARDLRSTEDRLDIDYIGANAPGAFEASSDGLQRIATIVRAMKEFSHPDQRDMEPADLNAAIVNTLTIARNEYKYVADVEKALGDLPPVPCYVGDICQVILNILVNAAHAIGDVVRVSGKRGLIKVRSMVEPGFARIEIEDNGTGISEAAQKRVFEPFFTTKEVGKGTGQGLTLAHTIVVKKHRGTLSFDTTVGKGTTFIIRLPLSSTAQKQAGDDSI